MVRLGQQVGLNEAKKSVDASKMQKQEAARTEKSGIRNPENAAPEMS